MSKRGGDSTRIRATKVKKRKGVGSRTIVVLDSDEESVPPTANDYARVTKTRVAISGKAERIATSSVPIFEVEKVNATPLEPNMDVPGDTGVVDVDPVVPAKRRKRANDSVSGQIIISLGVANNTLDQDVLLA